MYVCVVCMDELLIYPWFIAERECPVIGVVARGVLGAYKFQVGP